MLILFICLKIGMLSVHTLEFKNDFNFTSSISEQEPTSLENSNTTLSMILTIICILTRMVSFNMRFFW